MHSGLRAGGLGMGLWTVIISAVCLGPIPRLSALSPTRGAPPRPAIAEFLPEGGTPQIFQQLFTTGEAFGRPANPAIDVAPKSIDGMRVSLDASKATAGDTGPLTFRIEDAAGAPVTDLEPYLGASAHLLIVPIDLTDAIHGHPTEDGHGPVLSFAPLLPRPGSYKLWMQCQRGGRVSTASFVIRVP